MNDNISIFDISEEDAREKIIKSIADVNIKNNTAYQIMLNKFKLTPYIYENEEYNPIFNNYKEIAQSNIESFVLHPYQKQILDELEKGTNLVVSAPTSFGKTASIFEYVSRNKKVLRKILIIVPTIALRNEYLEKISSCIEKHTIITSSKDLENYNEYCMILTHEKFVEYFSKNRINKLDIDLLVIDEIYKLQNENDENRIYSMSLAYLTAIKVSKQYIFLGPFINSIELPDLNNYKIMKYDYSPIATNINYIQNKKCTCDNLIENINENEKTLVYFSSKQEIMNIIDNLFKDINDENKNKSLINFIATEYGQEWVDEWSVIKALKKGIGIHYNEVPSFIKEYMLNSYNNTQETMLLFATSTLLEGVNTSTKRIIITSNKIGSNELSDFEFWNLVGRAGRLGKYKVGEVTYYGNESDHKKEDRYIDLNKLWINKNSNIDEYEFINKGSLTNKEKQEKLTKIINKYQITTDEIKYIYLPFFIKIDKIIDFFENVYPVLINNLHEIIANNENEYAPTWDIRKNVFDFYVKKYKKTIPTGPLPKTVFSIISDALNRGTNSRKEKIKSVVNEGRNWLIKKKATEEEKKKKMNNLYNYSFYIVNNYIENSYIPAINILRGLIEKNNHFSAIERRQLNDALFIPVDAYIRMITEDEIYETLGIISPLITILKTIFNNNEIKNISELRKNIIDNQELILNVIGRNDLYMYYYNMLLKKLNIR